MRARSEARRAAQALAVALVAGCTVGADYAAPEFGTDGEWLAPQPGGAAEAGWWTRYDDPVLQSLVAMALERNRDLAIADARLAEARARRATVRGGLLPAAGAVGAYTWAEQSVASPAGPSQLIAAGLAPRDVEFYEASLDVSWELDLFGGTRRRLEAATADAAATEADRAAVALQVVAETVAAYAEWRGLSRRIGIARQNVELLARTRDITARKVDTGLARPLDALRAESEFARTAAGIPDLEAARAASLQRLAILCGAAAGELPLPAAPEAVLPVNVEAVPIGLRADLLRRRPDIAAAERRLAASSAALGAAQADFFPKLALNASGGFEAGDSGDLFTGASRTVGIAPFVRWPVFQGGRLRAEYAAAGARSRAAMAAYERAVLAAFADAESAIAAFDSARASLLRWRTAAAASREAESIARRLYEQGLADFLTLIDAQRQRIATEDGEAQAQTRVRLNLARLYKALGGGWQAASG